MRMSSLEAETTSSRTATAAAAATSTTVSEAGPGAAAVDAWAGTGAEVGAPPHPSGAARPERPTVAPVSSVRALPASAGGPMGGGRRRGRRLSLE